MTDRELLELAAKAAGIHIMWSKSDDGGILIDHNAKAKDPVHHWNPLTDDGEALRLAVKLQIDIEFPNESVVFADGNWSESAGQDRGKAVRRAIVRAAAEIGQAM